MRLRLLFYKEVIIITDKKKYSRTVKCPQCGEQLDRNTESFTEHSGRYYHQECYEVKNAGGKDRKELLDYIKKLYGNEISYPLITKQIKDLVDEYGYTLKGIELTLKYFYEIEGNSLAKSKGIGIVPYAYEDAKSYYSKIIRIQKSFKNMDQENKIKKVSTSPEKKRRKRKKIDIGGI